MSFYPIVSKNLNVYERRMSDKDGITQHEITARACRVRYVSNNLSALLDHLYGSVNFTWSKSKINHSKIFKMLNTKQFF